MKTKTIIDLSSENGKINWDHVHDVDGVILRCHQRFGIDEEFENNFAALKEKHIPVGVYKCSYATTVTKAKQEAKDVLAVLKGRRLEYPVFYDLEDDSLEALSKDKIDSIVKAFLRQIVKAGYAVGIYCNQYWYNTFISDSLKRLYPFWIASYGISKSPEGCMGWQYTDKGSVSGITGNVDMNFFYFEGDEELFTSSDENPTEIQNDAKNPTVDEVLNVIRSWIGLRESDGSHKKIIDIYNSHKPLAQGYHLSYEDSWCDATISAIFISLNATDLIGGTECGVDRHISLFKEAGIWIEDGTITPRPGDIICYNWDQDYQPNNGFADHIGIVETVVNGIITTIEGNASGMVKRCEIPVGYGYIRGFARPHYSGKSSNTVRETGKNRVLFTGKVVKKAYVKTWAGEEYPNITSYPVLNKGNVVDVMAYTQIDTEGNPWYFVRIAGAIFGFVKSSLVTNVV